MLYSLFILHVALNQTFTFLRLNASIWRNRLVRYRCIYSNDNIIFIQTILFITYWNRFTSLQNKDLTSGWEHPNLLFLFAKHIIVWLGREHYYQIQRSLFFWVGNMFGSSHQLLSNLRYRNRDASEYSWLCGMFQNHPNFPESRDICHVPWTLWYSQSRCECYRALDKLIQGTVDANSDKRDRSNLHQASLKINKYDLVWL